jgi:hypothetical protein
MTEMHRWFVVLLATLSVVMACSVEQADLEIMVPRTCRNHDECGASMRCEIAASHVNASAPIHLSAGPVGCPSCNNALACEFGQTCNPAAEFSVPPPCPQPCIPGCKHVDCPEDTMCIEGACATPALLCNSPDATFSCPEGMHCAPEEDAPDLFEWFGLGAIDDNVVAIFAMGCVPTQCDDDAGSSCGEGFRCDPADPSANAAGCVAIPCAELEECPNPDSLCRPAMIGESVDAHGCVLKNCTEGYVCEAINTVCDPQHLAIYFRGCRPVPLNSAGTAELPNDPAESDCSTGTPCSPPFICRPAAASPYSNGCIPPPIGTPCESDDDCSGRDYCVVGSCQAQPGVCQ